MKILSLYFLLLFQVDLSAQTDTVNFYNDTEYYAYRTWVVKNEKQCLIDRNGKTYITCDWNERYFDDLACPPSIDKELEIEIDGIGCMYDIYGKSVFCVKPEQQIVYSYSDEYMLLRVNDPLTNKTLYGWMDHKGNVVIQPIYDDVDHGSWSPYKAVKLNGKWGFIDKKGNTTIAFEFDEAESFYGSYAVVKKNGFCGLIDQKANAITEFKYEWIETYTSSFRTMKMNGKFGMLDEKGKQVISPKYTYLKNLSGGSFLANTDGVPEYKTDGMAFCHGGKWMVIDINEKIEKHLDCDHLISFHGGLNRAEKNGKWGYLGGDGTWIIQPQFEEISIQTDPCRVKKNGKWGVMDNTGKWILEPKFEGLEELEYGLAPAKENGKWGFVNEKYEWVIPPQYDFACGFYEISVK